MAAGASLRGARAWRGSLLGRGAGPVQIGNAWLHRNMANRRLKPKFTHRSAFQSRRLNSYFNAIGRQKVNKLTSHIADWFSRSKVHSTYINKLPDFITATEAPGRWQRQDGYHRFMILRILSTLIIKKVIDAMNAATIKK